MGPVSKSTVQAVFRAVALGVGLMDADPGLVVAEVVAALRVPRGPVQERAPATQWGCVSLCLPRCSGGGKVTRSPTALQVPVPAQDHGGHGAPLPPPLLQDRDLHP